MTQPRDSFEKAQQIAAAVDWRDQPISMQRDGLTLVLDAAPAFIRNRDGVVVGIDAMVRLFDGAREIPVDPHRILVNPPLVPRANLTYEEGSRGGDGVFVGTGSIATAKTAAKGVAYRRIVGAPDPRAAYFEALFDSVIRVPNAKGWRTRGTVTTVYATPPGGNGYAQSVNATYATARTGGTLNASNEHRVGQTWTGSVYGCYESFIIFDTSGVPDTDAVSAVVLSLDGNSDNTATDFTAAAAASSYDGGAVVTGDWVSGAAIPTPELATWNSAGYSAGYNAFTETADFKDAINKTGNTSLILYSQRHRDSTTPTGQEYLHFTDADAAGTTTDPKLDITHAAGGGGGSTSDSASLIAERRRRSLPGLIQRIVPLPRGLRRQWARRDSGLITPEIRRAA